MFALNLCLSSFVPTFHGSIMFTSFHFNHDDCFLISLINFFLSFLHWFKIFFLYYLLGLSQIQRKPKMTHHPLKQDI